MAYSLDLRQRVVDAVRKAKQTKEEIARIFSVSVPTINRWLRRERLAADKPGPTNAHKIDRDKLKDWVAKEPDYYLEEYAEKLGSKRSTVAYNLKVLELMRKKNHTVRREK
jgi:excisionase family DNA binding protein